MIRVNDAHHAIRTDRGKGRVCDHRWDEWTAAPAASYADFVCVGKQKKLSARCAECAPPKAAAATPGGAAPLLPQQHNDTPATQPQQEEPTVTPAGEVGKGAAADAAAGATVAVAEHDAGADVAAVAAEWAGTATAPGSPVAVLQHPAGAGAESEEGAGAGAGAGLGLFERFDDFVGLQCSECEGAGEPGGAAAGACSCCSLDPALDVPFGGAFAGGGMAAAAGAPAKRKYVSADSAVSSQPASPGVQERRREKQRKRRERREAAGAELDRERKRRCRTAEQSRLLEQTQRENLKLKKANSKGTVRFFNSHSRYKLRLMSLLLTRRVISSRAAGVTAGLHGKCRAVACLNKEDEAAVGSVGQSGAQGARAATR
jgi:hypothetical protein